MKATWDNLRPGVKVKCVYDHRRYDHTAIVETVNPTAYSHRIRVVWDDGFDRDKNWNDLSSFEILPDSNLARSPSEYEVLHGGIAPS